MSAPLVVNTADGACWTRRAVTEGGVALYALADVCSCPEFVMATFEELAARGIVGSAFVVPAPVGPESKPRTMLDHGRDALRARMTKDDLRLVLENVITYAASLETERHRTNEWADDAAEALRRDRDRIAELEVAAIEGRAALAALCHDLEDPGSNAFGALFLLQQATPGTPMEPGEPTPTVYRASHDSIVMGLYTTADAARAHCEAEERRAWAKNSAPTDFDWIEDEEDGVAELTAWVGGEECTTGYVVTALEVAASYDEGADE